MFIFIHTQKCKEYLLCATPPASAEGTGVNRIVTPVLSQNLHFLSIHTHRNNCTRFLQLLSCVPWLHSSFAQPSHVAVWDAAATAAKSLQSCPTLCDPIDGSPPGPTVPGILQARTLEWVAISSSNAWKWKVKVKSLSRVRLLVTPWTAAY